MVVATLAELARRLKFRGRLGRVNSRAALPPLILMTDTARLPDPTAIMSLLPAGTAVILRGAQTPKHRELARRLALACRRRRLRLLIAGDARLAAAIGAGGVHLPEAMATRGPGPWSRLARPDWIVTAAAHGPSALWRALRAGADAALLSPVFPTESHPGAPPLGPLRFALWCRRSPLPVYALGGIEASTARRLTASGAAGFAGTGGIGDAKKRPTASPIARRAGSRL